MVRVGARGWNGSLRSKESEDAYSILNIKLVTWSEFKTYKNVYKGNCHCNSGSSDPQGLCEILHVCYFLCHQGVG